MILDERKRIVRDGYDELASRLPDGAHVLDLGCGSGVPKAQRLAKPS